MRKFQNKNSKRQPALLAWWVGLPWLVAVAVGEAGAAFFWLLAPRLHLPGASTNMMAHSFDTTLHALYKPLGWICMFAGLAAGFASWRQAKIRAKLIARQQGLEDLKAMSWQQFEILVGECFRLHGWRVTETGQGGADGGIDLLLKRGKEIIIVQCKQWKTTSVGAPVVREMFGLMTHHKADRVKIVTCGYFTKEAWAFAKGKPVDLIGGPSLLEMVKEKQ